MIYKVTVERKCSKCELVRRKTDMLTESQLNWLKEWKDPDPWLCIRCKAEGTTVIMIVGVKENEVKKVKEKYVSGIKISRIWTNKT